MKKQRQSGFCSTVQRPRKPSIATFMPSKLMKAAELGFQIPKVKASYGFKGSRVNNVLSDAGGLA